MPKNYFQNWTFFVLFSQCFLIILGKKEEAITCVLLGRNAWHSERMFHFPLNWWSAEDHNKPEQRMITNNWMKADWMKEQCSSTVELEPTQLGSSSLLIFDCSNHLIIKNEIKHEFPFKNPPKTPLKVVKIIRKRAK